MTTTGGRMHDIVIRGGTVVDGTGSAPRVADVAVSDGVIVEVGTVETRAPRRSTPPVWW